MTLFVSNVELSGDEEALFYSPTWQRSITARSSVTTLMPSTTGIWRSTTATSGR
jgi:hypothetical protein